MKRLIFLSCCLFAGLCTVRGENQSNVEPLADHTFRNAGEFLAQAKQFNLTAEIWREHLTETGQKVQFSREVTMQLKRPNKLRVEIRAPFSDRCFWYDGKSLTVLDRKKNFYATAAMPNTVDAMLDRARDEFGIDLPLIDVALSNPYAQGMSKVQSGTYYTVAPVLDRPCHHLAFTQQNVDWQIWIEEGVEPVIRKFVITHKLEEGAPEFTALITHWDFLTPLADSNFEFEPPPGANKVEMRSVDQNSGKSSPSYTPTGRNPKIKE